MSSSNQSYRFLGCVRVLWSTCQSPVWLQPQLASAFRLPRLLIPRLSLSLFEASIRELEALRIAERAGGLHWTAAAL